MKLFLYLLMLFFYNCATMSVYDLAFPNTWKMSTNKNEIENVSVATDKKIRFKLKSWFGEKYKCFVPYEPYFNFELYAYSVKDCPDVRPTEDNVSLDKAFRPNHLPVLNVLNTVLDLSGIDNRSYYIYPSNLKKLRDLELQEVFYDKKKHKIYLITKSDFCTILSRNEYGEKIAQYSVETNWEIEKNKCINESTNSNLIPIPFFNSDKYTIYLIFNDGAYSVYTSSNIFGGKEKITYFVKIFSLEAKNNYAYTLLFPFAIIFDVVTFPIQIFYLYILGASLPAR